MRVSWVPGILIGFMCGASLAQQQAAPPHARDGGTRERIESLTIPPLANAPFSATVTTELTKILVDGSKQTNWNHRLIARDSSGRVFQERRFFMPNGDKVPTPVMELDYADPNRHELYVCRPQMKVCYESGYNPPPSAVSASVPAQRGTSSGEDAPKIEDLGQKMIEGVETVGSREVITMRQGVAGNEREEPTVKEFWYSPQLGINVITKRFDPRFGAQNFTVSGIARSEPDPKLFAVPDGYRVVKMGTE
jgi:hypothetical protein